MRKLYALLLLILCLIGGAVVTTSRAQTALGPGWYDDDFFLLDYNAEWIVLSGAGLCADDGDRHRANVTSPSPGSEATLSFSFWGDGFSVFTYSNTGDPANGFDVCVLGGGCVFISTYNGGVSASIAIDYPGFGYGSHEVLIVQSVGQIAICSILIHPPAPQPTLEPVEIVVTLQVEADDLQFPTQIPPVPVGEPAYRTYFQVPSTGEPQFLAVDNIVTPSDLMIVALLIGVFFLMLRQMVRMRRRDE